MVARYFLSTKSPFDTGEEKSSLSVLECCSSLNKRIVRN